MTLWKDISPPTLVRARCRVCHLDESPLVCGLCNVVPYCSRECMLGDRSAHRRLCRKINNTRVAICDTEAKVHGRLQEDAKNPWRRPSFKRYMGARRSEIDALLNVETYEAYERAWIQSKDMLLFSKKDVLGIRYNVPFLLLRLRKEQELFDFLNWCATRPGESIRELDSPEHRNKDIFGGFNAGNECAEGQFLYLYFLLILLKTKILVDVRNLRRPPEERGDISEAVSRELWNASAARLKQVEDSIGCQISLLYPMVHFANRDFWHAFLQPNRYSNADVGPHFQSGSFEELQFVLQKTERAWAAIPEAGVMVRNLAQQNMIRLWRFGDKVDFFTIC